MASKENNGINNLKAQKAAYKQLQGTIDAVSKSQSGSRRQLADTLSILELIKKGYINITKDASKLKQVLDKIAKQGGLKDNLQGIGPLLKLSTDGLKDAEAIQRRTNNESDKSLRRKIKQLDATLTGSKDLLLNLENQKEVQEEITEEVDKTSDAMDSLAGIQDQVADKLASNLKLQNSISFATALTGIKVSEVAGELGNLGVLAAAIDPIIDSDPVNDVDAGIANIQDALGDISSSNFTINGIDGDLASSIALAKDELDNLLSAKTEEMNIRTNFIVPEKISAELQKQ